MRSIIFCSVFQSFNCISIMFNFEDQTGSWLPLVIFQGGGGGPVLLSPLWIAYAPGSLNLLMFNLVLHSYYRTVHIM